MRLLVVATLFILGLSAPVHAGPHCTDEPQSKWMSEEEFRKAVAPMDIEIVVLKRTSGNCYEIYGRDADGARIEIYFNPITAEIVRSSED